MARTNDYPSCVHSAAAGRLQNVFFSNAAFEVDINLLDVQPTTTMAVNHPYCLASPSNSSLTVCDGEQISGLLGGSFTMGFSLLHPAPLDSLGCFLISGSSDFNNVASNGWPIGLFYEGADCGGFYKCSRMIDQLCRPVLPENLTFTSPNIDENVVHTQVSHLTCGPVGRAEGGCT